MTGIVPFPGENGSVARTMTTAAVILFLLAIFLVSWVRVQEKSSLFFPSRDLHTLPSGSGLAYEDVTIPSDGFRIHGWYLPGPASEAVLWLHGNAGNIADRLDHAAAMNRELGVSSFLVDYRGYGRSEGKPAEKGLYKDAAAAFRWLVAEKGIDPSSIVLFGHSLGSAVAVDLALGEGKGAGGLVLESSFTKAGDVARMLYNGLPVDLLMSVRLDTIGRIGKVSMPVLVIHGEEDTTIPFAMGEKVFKAAPEPKAFLAVSGADHSDCYIIGGERYWEEWKEMLGTVKRQTSRVQRGKTG